MMSQEEIQIKHVWKFNSVGNDKRVFMYSNSFASDCIDGVKFNIFSGILNEDKFIVVLSKKPSTPANATVEIRISDSDEYEQKHVFGWINNYTLEFFSDPNSLFYYTCNVFQCQFQCIITWHGSKQPISDIHKNLTNFLTSHDLSDAIIVIDDEEIPVHKIILAAYSPVFLSIFKADPTESVNKRIIVTDIKVDTLKKILHFMYTGVYLFAGIQDLLLTREVAIRYEITTLKKLCSRELDKEMNVENVLEILERVGALGDPQLMETVISFMVKHKSAIIKLEKLADLHRRKPKLLLEFVVRSIIDDLTIITK